MYAISTPLLYASESPKTTLNEEQRTIRDRILEKAEEEGLDGQLLARIAYCESKYQMKWNYMHNIDPDYYTAYGVFQVIKGHEETYGISRMDLEGNLEIAFLLFRDKNVQPWILSESCWL